MSLLLLRRQASLSAHRALHCLVLVGALHPWAASADSAAATAPLQMEPAAEALIQRGIENSPQLALALARLREARATQGQVEGSRHPQVDLQASQGVVRSEPVASGSEKRRQRSQVQADFRWELDLLGRRQAEVDAGGQRTEAAQADLQAARLALGHALRGELLRLRSAEAARQQRRALLQTLEAQERLEGRLLTLGLRSRLEHLRLGAELTQRRQELALAEQAVALAGLRLAQLSDLPLEPWLALSTGVLPGGYVDTAPPLQQLAQRPDIHAAEARLRASQADARAAKRALWPTLRIDGQLLRVQERGGLGTALRDSTERFLGLGLAWALLDGGQRRSAQEATAARAEQAAAEFRRTVLVAAEEAHGALAQLQGHDEALRQADTAAAQLATAAVLARQQEQLGLISRAERLRLERASQESALAATLVKGERLQAVLAWMRALGQPS